MFRKTNLIVSIDLTKKTFTRWLKYLEAICTQAYGISGRIAP
jgi:hypothetical protein